MPAPYVILVMQMIEVQSYDCAIRSQKVTDLGSHALSTIEAS